MIKIPDYAIPWYSGFMAGIDEVGPNQKPIPESRIRAQKIIPVLTRHKKENLHEYSCNQKCLRNKNLWFGTVDLIYVTDI